MKLSALRPMPMKRLNWQATCTPIWPWLIFSWPTAPAVSMPDGTCVVDSAREMSARLNGWSLFVTSQSDAARAAKDTAVGCLRQPYSGSDLLAAVQAAEDYLKIKKLTPCSLRLEFYEGSSER